MPLILRPTYRKVREGFIPSPYATAYEGAK